MNKNSVYLAIFAVLCVLTGVLVGASITQRPHRSGYDLKRPDFRQSAERFMGYGLNEKPGKKGFDPIKMFTARLGLNADQKVKVSLILENARQKIDEIGKNVRRSIDEIREQGDQQIMEILNPAQQKKFKALQKELEKNCPFKGPQGQGEPARERRDLPPGEELPPTQE